MNISQYSRVNVLRTFEQWQISNDYAEPIYNYLIHGLFPGGFWQSVLANDFMSAMSHSHIGNSIPALKHVVGWIENYMPKTCYGSYANVHAWLKIRESDRRAILEEKGLIFSEQQEILVALSGKMPEREPDLSVYGH